MGNRTRNHDEIDAALGGARADASDELVAELSGRVLAAPLPRARSHRGSRVMFALALSVFMLGTFASFGGLGYAATNQTAQNQNQSAAADDCKDESGNRTSAGAEYCEEDVPDPTAIPATPSTKPPSPSVAVAGQSTAGAPQATNDSLPFTGYGLGGTALVGSALLALGIVLRRREARE